MGRGGGSSRVGWGGEAMLILQWRKKASGIRYQLRVRGLGVIKGCLS